MGNCISLRKDNRYKPNEGNELYMDSMVDELKKDSGENIDQSMAKNKGIDEGSIYMVSKTDLGATTYEGYFKGDTKQGQGRLVTPYFEYVGNFEENLFSGPGEVNFTKGQMFKGNFVGGKAEGKAIYKDTNGVTYTGIWKGGFLQGEVEEKYMDKVIYVGQYAKNQRSGKGKLYVKDGLYEGDFKNNLFEGTGKLSLMGGRYTYEGEWQANVRHGKGREMNGEEIYEGGWMHGRRHGKGRLETPQGVQQGVWYLGVIISGGTTRNLAYLREDSNGQKMIEVQ